MVCSGPIRCGQQFIQVLKNGFLSKLSFRKMTSLIGGSPKSKGESCRWFSGTCIIFLRKKYHSKNPKGSTTRELICAPILPGLKFCNFQRSVTISK